RVSSLGRGRKVEVQSRANLALGTLMRSLLGTFDLSLHRFHGIAERFRRGSAVPPTERSYLRAVKADNRHVPLPAAVTAAKFISYFLWVKPGDCHCQIRDLSHRNVIICSNVKNIVWLTSIGRHEEDRFQHIIDVDIAFLLSAVPEDAQHR